ncbi:MAG: adenylate/guanylate cyclase domain-containing protein, partial [Gammaproteobacteria bacterium]|nr:adenylate/guanylate cyclase domain-containing protein [Gammaproteobacteria bacterium]
EYREIIDGLIARHDGRVFSTGGDSVLAEFSSAVEAVRCAISWQEEIAGRNAELASDRQLKFRIGINVGDVMIRDGDLFGDGVNLVARLEALADPGGVCISGDVYRQVRGKLDAVFVDLGEQTVKNISEAVRVYGIDLAAAALDYLNRVDPVEVVTTCIERYQQYV